MGKERGEEREEGRGGNGMERDTILWEDLGSSLP